MVNKWKEVNVDKDVEVSEPQEEVSEEAVYEDWVKVAARDIAGACIGFDRPMNGVLNDIAKILSGITKEKEE